MNRGDIELKYIYKKKCLLLKIICCQLYVNGFFFIVVVAVLFFLFLFIQRNHKTIWVTQFVFWRIIFFSSSSERFSNHIFAELEVPTEFDKIVDDNKKDHQEPIKKISVDTQTDHRDYNDLTERLKSNHHSKLAKINKDIRQFRKLFTSKSKLYSIIRLRKNQRFSYLLKTYEYMVDLYLVIWASFCQLNQICWL